MNKADRLKALLDSAFRNGEPIAFNLALRRWNRHLIRTGNPEQAWFSSVAYDMGTEDARLALGWAEVVP